MPAYYDFGFDRVAWMTGSSTYYPLRNAHGVAEA